MSTAVEYAICGRSSVNLHETFGRLRAFAFRAMTITMSRIPGGKVTAFGQGRGQIGSILIVNLERQPLRLRRTFRELKRFKTERGALLTSIATRFAAVDARDGRAVAATADVDTGYHLGDQLYVQPDARLEECFNANEPVTMTRQEVAVARSHIEAWKKILSGDVSHVLILEDDIWFRPGAARAIDRGWLAAVKRSEENSGPDLLYLSYSDADGTVERLDVCADLFRPKRGLWFLSGYVLSREGAQKLLKAMPVTGPVDMWMNRRFDELSTLALSSPAILQRPDGGSDNSYSIMPYLARAGIVDANALIPPRKVAAGPLIAWTGKSGMDSLAMALSMLGLRVRAFDPDDETIGAEKLEWLFGVFDALIDPPLKTGALNEVMSDPKVKFLMEAEHQCPIKVDGILTARIVNLPASLVDDASWAPICELLDLAQPIDAFPNGTPSEWRLFRQNCESVADSRGRPANFKMNMDESAWALDPADGWPPKLNFPSTLVRTNECLIEASLKQASPDFLCRTETFPGNLASFDQQGVTHDSEGVTLTLQNSQEAMCSRPFRSGAIASMVGYCHGRFEVDIKAASGKGLVTGFFLHRAGPRQEIDIEITGDDPRSILLNVYFNPGDDRSSLGFGYRGSPCRIDLGFDASLDFHRYSIDWRPDCITWAVDDRIIHRRASWHPTPIPHLPMTLHGNLWAPRSQDLAGRIDVGDLPAKASLRNIRISS